MSKSILDHFPNGWTPTDLQRDVLLELEARWNSAQVFVLKLDVASGKSGVAACIANWAGSARICTPTNVLVDQYAKAIESIPSVKSAGNYACKAQQTRCGAVSSKNRCKGCVYNKALKTAKEAPVSVSTIHMSKVLYPYRGTMIFDEAHNLSKIIRDMHSKKLFAHKVNMPKECVNDTKRTEEWVLGLKNFNGMTKTEEEILKAYKADLEADKPSHFYSWSTDFWSNGGLFWGEKLNRSEPIEAPILTQQPLDIFTKPSLFWKDKQKLVLMSATIGRHDLYELGLDRTRPIFIEGDPPISFDRNPIYKDYVGRITHANTDAMLQPLVDKILHYLNTKEGKGVIHITYGLAKKLKPLLKHERLITHTNTNMRKKLKEFISSNNKVFMVSGMYEGISLDYHLASWQVITKIVWPSLLDPLQKYRSEDDPDYYLWSTLKNVIQTSGRVCRRPDDYGSTHIWDESFERLLDEGKHLIPYGFRGRIND